MMRNCSFYYVAQKLSGIQSDAAFSVDLAVLVAFIVRADTGNIPREWHCA